MWRHFRSDSDEERPHLLHNWVVILIGLALAPLLPLLGLAAVGLAFHRLLDDLHGVASTQDRSVDSHVKNLRKKLEAVANHPMIETIYGIGYRYREL